MICRYLSTYSHKRGTCEQLIGTRRRRALGWGTKCRAMPSYGESSNEGKEGSFGRPSSFQRPFVILRQVYLHHCDKISNEPKLTPLPQKDASVANGMTGAFLGLQSWFWFYHSKLVEEAT